MARFNYTLGTDRNYIITPLEPINTVLLSIGTASLALASKKMPDLPEDIDVSKYVYAGGRKYEIFLDTVLDMTDVKGFNLKTRVFQTEPGRYVFDSYTYKEMGEPEELFELAKSIEISGKLTLISD